MTKVVVNGGHEPNVDSGAVGSRSTEADITQKLMFLVAAYLEKAGCEVMAVQTAALAEICRVSNEWGADIFVSPFVYGELEFYAVVLRTESFERRSVEFFLMVRMCNADKEFSTFLHRPAIKVYGTKFSNHIMHMRSCSYNSTTFNDYRGDLAASFICCRRHGNDGLTLRCK